MEKEKNYFQVLNGINLNSVKEKKNGLDYISWAWAWGKVKELHPDASSKVYENDMGWPYFTDGNTCWVKVGMTINGLEHIEYLPIMDYKNQSIPVSKVTSMDVNKAIQRGLTKAIARHGLGLYVYAGEDLPETVNDPNDALSKAFKQTNAPKSENKPVSKPVEPPKSDPDPAVADVIVAPQDKEMCVMALEALGTDINKVLTAYKYKSVEEMPLEKLQEAYRRKKASQKKEAV